MNNIGFLLGMNSQKTSGDILSKTHVDKGFASLFQNIIDRNSAYKAAGSSSVGGKNIHVVAGNRQLYGDNSVANSSQMEILRNGTTLSNSKRDILSNTDAHLFNSVKQGKDNTDILLSLLSGNISLAQQNEVFNRLKSGDLSLGELMMALEDIENLLNNIKGVDANILEEPQLEKSTKDIEQIGHAAQVENIEKAEANLLKIFERYFVNGGVEGADVGGEKLATGELLVDKSALDQASKYLEQLKVQSESLINRVTSLKELIAGSELDDSGKVIKIVDYLASMDNAGTLSHNSDSHAQAVSTHQAIMQANMSDIEHKHILRDQIEVANNISQQGVSHQIGADNFHTANNSNQTLIQQALANQQQGVDGQALNKEELDVELTVIKSANSSSVSTNVLNDILLKEANANSNTQGALINTEVAEEALERLLLINAKDRVCRESLGKAYINSTNQNATKQEPINELFTVKVGSEELESKNVDGKKLELLKDSEGKANAERAQLTDSKSGTQHITQLTSQTLLERATSNSGQATSSSEEFAIKADFDLMRQDASLLKSDQTPDAKHVERALQWESAREAANLAKMVQQANQAGATKLTVRLMPEHLGKLEIQIMETAGRLSVKIIANSQEARNLLSTHADTIQQNLLNKGIHIDSMDLSFHDSTHKRGEEDAYRRMLHNKKQRQSGDKEIEKIHTKTSPRKSEGLYA